MWVRSLDCVDLLEEGIATHFSILAQRISWTEEPGRLRSVGSQELDTTEAMQHACVLFGHGYLDFPDGSEGKESVCNAGDTGEVGLIPRVTKSWT